MQAVVIQEPGRIEVTEVPDPVPGPKDVVVRVAGCGICGTDLHILDGEFAPTLPVIPGHEFAGEVVAVGPEVPTDRVRVGDQVAVDPSLHCGECYYCRRGRGNLCENWAAIGVSTAGGAAEFAVTPFANCYLLPDGVSTADAALIEPLSCPRRWRRGPSPSRRSDPVQPSTWPRASGRVARNPLRSVPGWPVKRRTVSVTSATSPLAIATYVLTHASTCQSGAP